jgi:hypothetical protein
VLVSALCFAQAGQAETEGAGGEARAIDAREAAFVAVAALAPSPLPFP